MTPATQGKISWWAGRPLITPYNDLHRALEPEYEAALETANVHHDIALFAELLIPLKEFLSEPAGHWLE